MKKMLIAALACSLLLGCTKEQQAQVQKKSEEIKHSDTTVTIKKDAKAAGQTVKKDAGQLAQKAGKKLEQWGKKAQK